MQNNCKYIHSDVTIVYYCLQMFTNVYHCLPLFTIVNFLFCKVFFLASNCQSPQYGDVTPRLRPLFNRIPHKHATSFLCGVTWANKTCYQWLPSSFAGFTIHQSPAKDRQLHFGFWGNPCIKQTLKICSFNLPWLNSWMNTPHLSVLRQCMI